MRVVTGGGERGRAGCGYRRTALQWAAAYGHVEAVLCCLVELDASKERGGRARSDGAALNGAGGLH
jgi:hypothetical protein